jgi:hypothetical protein
VLLDSAPGLGPTSYLPAVPAVSAGSKTASIDCRGLSSQLIAKPFTPGQLLEAVRAEFAKEPHAFSPTEEVPRDG